MPVYRRDPAAETSWRAMMGAASALRVALGMLLLLTGKLQTDAADVRKAPLITGARP